MAQSIIGEVVNEEGQPMQEVTVFLDGTPQKTITDHRGYFAFEDLEKGTYRLVVFSPGYKQQFKDVMEILPEEARPTLDLGARKSYTLSHGSENAEMGRISVILDRQSFFSSTQQHP